MHTFIVGACSGWEIDIYMIRRRYGACTVNTEQYTGRERVSKVLHCIYTRTEGLSMNV